MQPSDLLLAAADHIRDLAAATTTGPWSHQYGITQEDESVVYVVDAASSDAIGDVGEVWTQANAQWIAALSPAVAPALEKVLREATGMWRMYESRGWPEEEVRVHVGSAAVAALDLAIAVFGEGSHG